jgi:AraC family transcriptional regulator
MIARAKPKTLITTPLLPNSNFIDYSAISNFSAPSVYSNFSIKYVVSGTEMYSANGNKYFVGSKEYLVANRFCEGYVEIESKKPVVGICIELSPATLSEVVATHLQPNSSVPDIELDRFFNTDNFLENKYAAGNTRLGKLLLELDTLIANQPVKNIQFGNDFYFSLAESIVEDHISVFKNLQRVKAVKNSTKKDLLRKLLCGKNYIEQNICSPVTIEQIAKESGLGEYHFFRLFKAAFGISPHQYLIQQRLHYAKKMLQQQKGSISALAIETGFGDVHAFSKCFKKHFGVSPSLIR